MDKETRNVLARWRSLQKDAGLRRAGWVACLLWLVDLALFVFVVFGVVYGLHPVAIAIAAGIMGWVMAEKNALRTRLAQWPIFERDINWERVQADLGDDQNQFK